MAYIKFIKKLSGNINLYHHVLYVDMDTGEKLSERDVCLNIYRIVNKIKKTYKPSNNETARIIEYTNECRRNESTQTKLNLG